MNLFKSERKKQYIFVIKELVSREIKRKYARSSLGILWSVLNPMLSMLVLSMIFATIFKRSIENYPVYYLTGLIFWSMFTEATNSAMTALVDNKTLLIKVKLPMQVFPLSRSCTALTNFGYSMIAYIIILVIFRIKPNIYMPMIFLYAAALFMFSLGIGYILSVLYVLFGDIKHLYSSAIFYPMESTAPIMQEIIMRNPVYNYIACARKCIMYATLPSAEEWARLFIWSVGIYIIGKLYFDKMHNKVLQKV